jgi:hypothetical protein
MGLTVNQNKIFINLDHFVKQYFINPGFEYLLAAVYKSIKQDPNRDIEILAAIQTPLTLEPFVAIIDCLARVSGLPPSRIQVKTRNRSLAHPKATVVVLDDREFFCLTRETLREISSLEFKYHADPKLFGALFGRCSFPRLDLAYYLDTCYHDHSVITFHATQRHVEDCVSGIEIVFDKHLEWAKTWKNPEGVATPECERGAVNFPTNLRTWPELWGRYFIEIVVETDYHNTWDWTEKTWKCLTSGKPFIIMSGPGCLSEMRSMGFKTFEPWINEAYDLEYNAWHRLDLIKNEIARLASLDKLNQEATITALLQIADFNKNRAKEIYV